MHIYELVQDKYRPMSSTVLNIFDDCTFLIVGFALKFMIRDLNMIFKWTWIVETIALVLYLLLIPESPKWLFFAEGPDSQRGIAALNYIAWINGSRYHIPKCAKVDLFGEAILDNQSLIKENNTAIFK